MATLNISSVMSDEAMSKALAFYAVSTGEDILSLNLKLMTQSFASVRIEIMNKARQRGELFIDGKLQEAQCKKS